MNYVHRWKYICVETRFILFQVFIHRYIIIIITVFPWLSDAINLDSIFLVKEETESH